MPKTAILLIGFGGPTKPEEVRPFLASVVGHAKIPQERLDEVLRHYEKVGNVSAFNAITRRQQTALEAYLNSMGPALPVGVAYRHSTPTFKDAFESYRRFGVERVIGFVLASFRSSASFQKYVDKVEEGRSQANAEAITVEYSGPFVSDPLYLEAQTARINEVWGSWPAETKNTTELIFTAHSIPISICQESTSLNKGSCYGLQYYEAAKSIAALAGAKNWRIAYQSRSGSPRDLWLEPDVKDVFSVLDRNKIKRVLLVPIGFLCENVEIAYDLDDEARSAAQSFGFEYFRAQTVSDHPLFIKMMASKVLEKIPLPVVE